VEIFQIQATGLRAIGLLAGALLLYLIVTGVGFSRTCEHLGDYRAQIKTDLTAREMRRMLRDIRGKSTSEMNADPATPNQVDQLRVAITELKCADTFVLGIVCRVTYHLGTNDDAGPDRQEYFSLRNSGRSYSWFDFLGPRTRLFDLSWRHCTQD
jgi:hypothetical protein